MFTAIVYLGGLLALCLQAWLPAIILLGIAGLDMHGIWPNRTT